MHCRDIYNFDDFIAFKTIWSCFLMLRYYINLALWPLQRPSSYVSCISLPSPIWMEPTLRVNRGALSVLVRLIHNNLLLLHFYCFDENLVHFISVQNCFTWHLQWFFRWKWFVSMFDLGLWLFSLTYIVIMFHIRCFEDLFVHIQISSDNTFVILHCSLHLY